VVDWSWYLSLQKCRRLCRLGEVDYIVTTIAGEDLITACEALVERREACRTKSEKALASRGSPRTPALVSARRSAIP
jgi:hypothetical protein